MTDSVATIRTTY